LKATTNITKSKHRTALVGAPIWLY